MAKKGKSKIMDSALTAVKLVAGGYIANQVSNFMEQQSFASDFKDYVPAVPVAVGVAGAIFAPESMKPVAYGMVAVGGTELIENIINKATTPASTTSTASTTVNGFPTMGQMGYVPQVQPDDVNVIKVNNTPVR